MKKFLIGFSLAAISSVAAGAGELVPVFQEHFSKCKSSVIQGGYFSEDYYFNSGEHSDNDGWYSRNSYVSERAIKFSAKTKQGGYAITPALSFASATASKVVVRFRAQTWAHKDDMVEMCVQVEGDASTMQKVDADASTNISNRSEEPFELTFTNVPDGAQLRFGVAKKEGAAVDRCFLSDIVVLEERESVDAPAIHTSAGYHHFADIMVGNDSEMNTIKVEALGLSSDIEIKLPAQESNFTIAKKDWNPRSGGTLEINFTPLRAGHMEECVNIVAGEASSTFILTGNAKVYTPVADAASNVSEQSFTANWHRVAGLDRVELCVYTKEKGALKATDLMFSKYIEGKSNNRALEIFNGTGNDVSLDGYRLLMENNGAGGFTFGEYAFEADAVVPAGGTFTVCNANFNAVRDIADVTIGFNNGGYANIMTFTGDDAIGLFAPDGRLIDALGYESTDVNDEVSGNWGQDKSFYRKTSVYMPSDKFRIEQWNIHPMDYFEGYGSHALDATGDVIREIKRIDITDGATSADITGIPADTPCFYTVQGYSAEFKTLVSQEIEVGNASAGIDDVTIDNTATEQAAYDIAGRRVDAASAKGVVIVRYSDGTARKVLR